MENPELKKLVTLFLLSLSVSVSLSVLLLPLSLSNQIKKNLGTLADIYVRQSPGIMMFEHPNYDNYTVKNQIFCQRSTVESII